MGCMQIMPATWRYLTARYALGSDPWNARFNMIGGALYLAELARQFGFPGAYAAYNAGPGRYARHVRGTARLSLLTGSPSRCRGSGRDRRNRSRRSGCRGRADGRKMKWRTGSLENSPVNGGVSKSRPTTNNRTFKSCVAAASRDYDAISGNDWREV